MRLITVSDNSSQAACPKMRPALLDRAFKAIINSGFFSSGSVYLAIAILIVIDKEYLEHKLSFSYGGDIRLAERAVCHTDLRPDRDGDPTLSTDHRDRMGSSLDSSQLYVSILYIKLFLLNCFFPFLVNNFSPQFPASNDEN